jgi:DNA repair exonuclease SbcCD ATPase subunit
MSNSQMSDSNMSNNEADRTAHIQEKAARSHSAIIGILVAGLVIALAGDGYLIVRSGNLDDQIAQLKGTTQAQMSKLSETTANQMDQRLQSIGTDVQSAHEKADSAIKQAKAEVQRQSAQLSRKMDEAQQQVAGQLVELNDATTTAKSKLDEVSADVSGVKTDVTGVKTDVTGVKTDVASTQAQLEKNGAQLKQALGDMGVMSGLIATNGKDLQALRDLGDRNYFEFDLSKGQLTKKVGDITISLKKADPKRNRYTVDILADDRHVEKRDRTVNEPVQLYVSENRQPYEVVVNQIKKDEVVGYLATPKVKVARR